VALKRKVSVVLTVMPGPEPWVRIAHNRGWFKVPGDVCVLEVINGAIAGWTSTRRTLRHSEATVRVPLTEWMRLTGGPVTAPPTRSLRPLNP
jgi:hypothetical protein